jgi:hypothetical protein
MSNVTRELADLMADAAAFQEIKMSMLKVGQLDPKTEHTNTAVVRLATENAVRALNYERAINAAPLNLSLELVATPDTRRITVEETGNMVLGELCAWLRDNGYLPHIIPTVDQLRDALKVLTSRSTLFGSVRNVLAKGGHLGNNPDAKSDTAVVGKVSWLAASPRADENKTVRNKLRRFEAQHAAVCGALNQNMIGGKVQSFNEVITQINAQIEDIAQGNRYCGVLRDIRMHVSAIGFCPSLGAPEDTLAGVKQLIAQHGKVTSEPAVLALREIRDYFTGNGYSFSAHEQSVPSALVKRLRDILDNAKPVIGQSAQIDGILRRVIKAGYTHGTGTALEHISEAVDRMLAKIKGLDDQNEQRGKVINQTRELLFEVGLISAGMKGDYAAQMTEGVRTALAKITELGALHNNRQVDEASFFNRARNVLHQANYCGVLSDKDNVLEGLLRLVEANRERRAAGNEVIDMRNELQKAGFLGEPTAESNFAKEVKGCVRQFIAAYAGRHQEAVFGMSDAVAQDVQNIYFVLGEAGMLQKGKPANLRDVLACINQLLEARKGNEPQVERGKIKDVLIAAGLADELQMHGVLACVEYLVRQLDEVRADFQRMTDEGAENAEQAAENKRLRRWLRKHGYGAAGMSIKAAVKVMHKAKHSTEGRFEAEQRQIIDLLSKRGFCSGDGVVAAVDFALGAIDEINTNDADAVRRYLVGHKLHSGSTLLESVTTLVRMYEGLNEQFCGVHSALCNAGMIATGDTNVEVPVRKLVACYGQFSSSNLTSDTAFLVRERLAKAGIVGGKCTTAKLLQELDLLLLGMRGTPNIKAFWESGNTLAKKLGLPDWATWSQIFERVDQMTRYKDAGEALADSMRNEPSFFVKVAERMRNAGLFANGVTATEALAHLDALLEARKSNVTREHAERLNTDRLRQTLGLSVDKTWPEVFDVVRDLLRNETELGNIKRVLRSEGIMTESMHTAVVDLVKQAKKGAEVAARNGFKKHAVAIGDLMSAHGYGYTSNFEAQLECIKNALKGWAYAKESLELIADIFDLKPLMQRVARPVYLEALKRFANKHQPGRSAGELEAVINQLRGLAGVGAQDMTLSAYAANTDLIEKANNSRLNRKTLVELIERHVGHNISDNFKSINEHVARALEFRTDVMSGGKSVANDNLRTALVLLLGKHGESCGNLSNEAMLEVIGGALTQRATFREYVENSRKGVLAAQANNDAALRADLGTLLDRYASPENGERGNDSMLSRVHRALAFRSDVITELEKLNMPGTLNSVQLVCGGWGRANAEYIKQSDMQKVFDDYGLTFKAPHSGTWLNAVSRALRFRREVCAAHGIIANVDCASVKDGIISAVKTLQSAKAYADDGQYFAAWQRMHGNVTGLYDASAHVMKVSQERLAEGKSAEATFGAALAGDLGQLAKKASVEAEEYFGEHITKRTVNIPNITQADVGRLRAESTMVWRAWFDESSKLPDSPHLYGNAVDINSGRPFRSWCAIRPGTGNMPDAPRFEFGGPMFGGTNPEK